MRANRLNLVGQRFGRLQVTRAAGVSRRGLLYWECICDCGNTCCPREDSLRSGATLACGCLSAIVHKFLRGGEAASPTALINLAEGRKRNWMSTEHRVKMARVFSETMKRTNARRKLGKYPEWDRRHSETNRIRMTKAWRDGSMTALTHRRVGIFRSQLKSKYAQELNAAGFTWLYEPKTFPVLLHGKVCSYTPDFYVIERDQWIEIKGFWRDQESREKVAAFSQQYPHLKFTVLLGAERLAA